MIIQTNLIPAEFDAITIWPFIFIRPDNANDKALIAHEMVHYIEQRNCGVLPWLIRYALSKKFRLMAEVRGYKKQIQIGGITTTEAANYLVEYGTGISFNDATALLTA